MALPKIIKDRVDLEISPQNICPECPNPDYVQRTGKCFKCIGL